VNAEIRRTGTERRSWREKDRLVVAALQRLQDEEKTCPRHRPPAPTARHAALFPIHGKLKLFFPKPWKQTNLCYSDAMNDDMLNRQQAEQSDATPLVVDQDHLRRIKGHMEVLHELFLNLYASYIMLRPIMVNPPLIQRLSEGRKAPGYRQLFDTLYWQFILDLVKIWGDAGKESDKRSPCLLDISACLKNDVTAKSLKEEHRSAYLDDAGEREKDFQMRCRRIQLITSLVTQPNHVLKKYKTVRCKNIAHNETRATPKGYTLYSIKELGLKYGQEKILLEEARVVLADLNAVVRDQCFDWDGFFEHETRQVADFWGISIAEQWVPPYSKSAERIFRL
jgi:ribosomal protein L13E